MRRLGPHHLDPAGATNGQVLGFDTALGRVTWRDAAAATAHTIRESLVATTGQNLLTLGGAPVSDGTVYVWVNGFLLWPGNGYTLDAGAASFDDPLAGGDVVWVSYATEEAAPPASTLSTVVPPGSAYFNEVMADTPIAYWRLGESSGTTMVDSSGNGRDGTYSGTYTLGATGLVADDDDTCIDFTSGKGLVADAPWMDISAITVEALVRLDAVSTAEIVERDSQGVTGGGRMFQFRVYNGRLELLLFAGFSTRTVTSNTVLSTATKYHLAATYDGLNLRLYINGSLDNTATAGSTVGLDTGTQPIAVGMSFADFWPTDGRLDEVALYGSALTGSRIADHAAAT